MNKRRALYLLAAGFVVLVVATIQVNSQFERLTESIEFSESLWSDMFDERDEIFEFVETWEDPNSRAAVDYLIEETRAVNKKYAKSFTVVKDTIERISLLPWNQAHHNVKASYLRHLDVRVGNLKNVGGILRTPEFGTTWDQFCSRATSSLPLLAFGRFDSRLAQVCARGID